MKSTRLALVLAALVIVTIGIARKFPRSIESSVLPIDTAPAAQEIIVHQSYKHTNAGFSLAYPPDVILQDVPDPRTAEMGLRISVTTAESPTTVDQLDVPVAGSDVVLERACTPVLERVATFERKGYRVRITLVGAAEFSTSDDANYFTDSRFDCPGKHVWKEGGAEQFLMELRALQGTPAMLTWYRTFDQIVGSITFQ